MPIENKVYAASEIDFIIHQVAERPDPRKVLMCTPEYFDVKDVKNVYMNNKEVNPINVKRQWLKLKDQYLKLKDKKLIDDLLFMRGAPDCEDMVFVINQSFPWVYANGEKVAVMSKLKFESRQKEMPYVKAYFEEIGYQTLELKNTQVFEGQGDTIPHPGKRLLYGGYGHRTTKDAYEELAELLKVPIIGLHLIDERFYHLEKCFLPIDIDTVIICPDAFSFNSLEAIKIMFKNVIRIPPFEASTRFSLTSHVLYDRRSKTKTALMHYGSSFVYQALESRGYEITELDTSEFIKSGGSVAGLKMMVY